MGEQNWFYARSGQREGPVSGEQIRQMLASGQLLATDLVWTEGMANWQAVQTLPQLTGSAPPPPLPAQPLEYAGPPPPGEHRDLGQDAGMRLLLPVGRSGWAIAAGYLGLFSFVIIPAPLALIASILAVLDLRRNPKLHGWGRTIFGLLMGLTGTVVLVIAIVAALFRHFPA